MGLKKALFISCSALALLLAMKIHSVFRVPAHPNLPDTRWGPEEEDEIVDTSIKPFNITIHDEILQDLRNRLHNTRKLPAPLQGVQQQYGFNTNTLNPILDYWLTKYDWRKREVYLNQFPQYKTSIQGLNIHYLHVKPNVPSQSPVYPLLIVHGWPGSVREFYKIIPLLTKFYEKYGFSFEVIAPSLPGYAFSDASSRPGLGAAEIAVVLKNLMKRIGHEKYYVQGGDWGAIILKNMATLFPDHILGLHTNMAISSGPKSLIKLLLGSLYPSLFLAEEDVPKVYPLEDKFQNFLKITGYLHLQATKPDSLGVGIHDSPAGLAAYILEKFSGGTNPAYIFKEDAGLLEKFTYEELIDNLMLYWVTGSFTSAIRIYAETFNKKQSALRLDSIPIDAKVPCAVARLPHEIVFFPEWTLRDKYTNLVQVTDFSEGGHFAALEVPELLAEDIFSAVAKMKNFHEQS